jgi:predicted DNA-binding protein (MmcQ/YjbR family)
MNIEELRAYFLSKPYVEEQQPFGDDILAFKVGGKIYGLMWLERAPFGFNVKCDPELAIDLRSMYPQQILPGYHMNKNHWNTVYLEGSLSDDQLVKQIDHSYELIWKSLSGRIRQQLQHL